MKTALLHYWLTGIRGGEKVLRELSCLYPEADIFTHACNRKIFDGFFGAYRLFADAAEVTELEYVEKCFLKSGIDVVFVFDRFVKK